MTEYHQNNERRFVCKFAAGAESQAVSAVWRIWSAKHKPDLFLGVNGIGQIKASVHCPTPEMPTWKRHFGFDRNAKCLSEEFLNHMNHL